MKELAAEKSASTDLAQESEAAINATTNRHPIIWMVFGAVCTLFVSAFVDTLQENRMLKAMVAQNIKPTAQLKRTGFDFTQPVNEIDWSGYRVELPVLPKPYKDTNVEI